MATPIGHPDDLTTRARDVLARVDVVAAEDTRVARALLRDLGIATPRLLSTHDHNEAQRLPQLLGILDDGLDVALVSDAGTPLISDPGFRVVGAAIAHGVPVVPLPGPCAAIAALSMAGLPTDRFLFLGFLHRQAGKRRRELEAVRFERATLVLYEAPHRILATLSDLEAALGPRQLALAISLTKEWERCHRGTPAQVHAALREEGEILGEMVLVVEGHDGATTDREAAADVLVEELARAGVSPTVIRDAVSRALGLPKRPIYQAALRAREG